MITKYDRGEEPSISSILTHNLPAYVALSEGGWAHITRKSVAHMGGQFVYGYTADQLSDVFTRNVDMFIPVDEITGERPAPCAPDWD